MASEIIKTTETSYIYPVRSVSARRIFAIQAKRKDGTWTTKSFFVRASLADNASVSHAYLEWSNPTGTQFSEIRALNNSSPHPPTVDDVTLLSWSNPASTQFSHIKLVQSDELFPRANDSVVAAQYFLNEA